jgi:peptide/nickel transport system substrate-binding protein
VVPEASTQVADLLSDRADLVTAVSVDQVAPIGDAGKQVVTQAVPGAAFVRIATDVAPFTDVRVRQALNHAVDVDAIVGALLGGEGRRLANLFPEGGLGYDPSLAPYTYDPDKARALLTEAGLADGFETSLEYASGESADIVTAIAAQLDAVGIRVELLATEEATFNAAERWKDPQAPPLRFMTWRPLFEPYTLLSLLVSETGFLSRYRSALAQPLIDAGAIETDPTRRAEMYRELGVVLHDEPAAIYLYNLTARYGVGAKAATWRPRPDEYVIATART